MSNGENLGLPTGGAPPIGPQQIQQFLASLFSGRQGQPQQAGGGASPARVGQVPNPPAVPNVGGMQPLGGPAMSGSAGPGATEGGPGRFPQISPAPVNQQVEFATKSGRNAAVTQNALAGIGSAVQQYKQAQYQKKMQAAKASVLQKVMMSQDPASQQQMQKLAQQDPKMAKIFEKQQADFAKYYDKAMTDPNSPEYYGFQQAYQELSQQAQLKDKMEQVRATIDAERQRAAQEQAHAALYTKQAQQEGQVTPLKEAEMKAQADRVRQQVAGSLQRTMVQAKTSMATTKMRADAYKYAADKAAGSRGTKTPADKTLEHMSKEYKNLQDQWKNLETQAKDLQTSLDKTPMTNMFWTSKEGHAKQQQIQSIRVQQETLSKQMDLVEQKRQVMEQVGALPSEEDINAPGDEQIDTESITVNPEDMEPAKPPAGK